MFAVEFQKKNVDIFLFLGELRRPSRSIPTGSVSALLFVFFIFITEILLMAATTDRYTLLNNYLFLQEVNIWEPFVVIGIVASVFSACLSGLIGSSRILEAVAVDEIFGKRKILKRRKEHRFQTQRIF